MKSKLMWLFMITILFSCRKDETVPDSEKPVVVPDSVSLSYFKFEQNKNQGKVSSDVYGKINGDEIDILVPSMLNNKKFVATFAVKNATVSVGDSLVTSGVSTLNYGKTVDYKLTSPKGTSRTYHINLKNYTGIPILYVNTTDKKEVTSKDEYLSGSVIVNTNNLFEQEKDSIPLQIKGRGNSTWGMPKKPYRLKFSNKAAMLGMGAAKNWVLLANYSDKTLMRTSIAFDLGRKIGANFTFPGRFVELVMNGEYAGNYYLTCQVEVHENRVNIPELKKSDDTPPSITGGYLLELDQRRDSDPRFETNRNIPLTIKSPEDITTNQLAYLKTYIQETEDAIVNEDFDPVNGYAKYIDVSSFINWYIVQELTSNQDAKDFSSIFFYKDRNGKLGMGPLWDFDLCAGNNDYSISNKPTGWWIKEGPWFQHLFHDPNFVTKLKARWNEIKGKEIKELPDQIDKTAAYLELSQVQNFKKWQILDKYVWPNQFVLGTYPAEVKQLKKWLAERTAWLDAEINKL